MSNLFNQALAAASGFPGVDSITLGNDDLPGQWILEPGGVTFSWQERKGWGLDGASLVATGRELAKPVFIARFWNVADWNAFQPLRQQYLSKAAYTLAALKQYALGLRHIELNRVGVLFVAPAEVPWFTNNGKGLWTGRVKFIEYRPPTIAQESPDATLPAAAAPTPSAADNAAAEGALHQNQIAGARG